MSSASWYRNYRSRISLVRFDKLDKLYNLTNVTMDIPVIYEDENIVAVNKPSGLLVHGDGVSHEPTLVDWFLERYPECADVGEAPLTLRGIVVVRPGIVHRLDRETSGVLVVAKNSAAHAWLKAQFQNRLIVKTYHALVYGVVRNDTGTIDAPIGRSSSDSRARSASAPRGTLREARTDYRVLERFPKGEGESSGCTYLEVYPKTGRTHQVRVHAKSIGHPVLCDRLYAPKRVCPSSMGRLALHALSLELTLPNGGGTVRIEADLPEEFTRTLELMRGL